MKRSVKTLSLTIPRDLYERIAALAERDGRSLSNYVGWVLGRHVDTAEVMRLTERGHATWGELEEAIAKDANSPVKPD